MMKMFKKILEGNDGGRLSQCVSVFAASIAVFAAGFHFGWPTPSLRRLMSDEYPFKITEDEASTITVISHAGHVMGGFIGGTLNDIIGRKFTMLAVSIPQIIAFLSIFFSYYTKALLYVARISGGIGEGAILAITPIYIAEISNPDIRGILAIAGTFSLFLGALVINLIGSYLEIYTTALICLMFPGFFLLIFTSMPESPYFLLMKNKTEEATVCLKTLKRKEFVDKELASLLVDVRRQMSERGTYKDIFIYPSNRKAFIIVACSRAFQQLTGIVAYTAYYQILLATTSTFSPVVGSSLIMIIQLVMFVSSGVFVDRLGRKPLIIISTSAVSLILFILGIFMILKDYTSLDLSSLTWFPLFMMILFTIFFSGGLAVIVDVLTSEMFSTSVKSKAVALVSVVFATIMIATTKYYQFTADTFSLAVPFITFSICSFIGTLFFKFVLIETKGKTLETIQQELKHKQ